jgi:hypothetical protein
MAIEPPHLGRDGWDLVQCDWGQRQRSEAHPGARGTWAGLVWRMVAAVRGVATRIWRRPARSEPS